MRGALLLLSTAAALQAGANADSAAVGAKAQGISAFKKLSLAELMDIEVTSVSRRPEPLGSAASGVQVLTGEDLRRAGATSLPMALSLVPNLNAAQVDSRQWAIAARGFNNILSNKLLVQLDGRTLYTPLFAGVFWDAQDTMLEDVERIEVISGPGATQWGSNAVNGIISITTKSARDTQGGLVSGGAGSDIPVYGSLRYGGTLARGLYYRVYGKYNAQESSTTAAGQDAGDAWHTSQGGFRVDWERLTSDVLTFEGNASQGRLGQAPSAKIRTNGSNARAKWTRTLGPRSQVAVQAYYDYTHRIIPGSITEQLSIYDLDLQHRLPLGRKHDLVWGGNYRVMEDQVVNPPTLAFLPQDVRREWVSGFVQDEVALVDERLRLSAGVKLEHNPYTGAELQPSVRAAWKWDERQRVWAAISRAVRTPSRVDREFFVPASAPFAVAGGPAFESEKLIAYELGYRAEAGRGLSVSVATFFHDYDDLRSVEPASPPGGAAVFGNGLKGRSYGAELSGDYRVSDRWRLRFGYTEQRVSSEPKPGSLDRTSSRSVAFDPKHHALLQSQFDLGPKVALDSTLRYVGRVAYHDVPGYTELDLRLSWFPFDSLELAVTGRNLLDHRHPEFGPSLPGRRELGRSGNGSFAWRF